MHLVAVSKNCTVREAAQVKLLSLKDSFSVESFFSLRIEIIRHIGLRHRIQYFQDGDFYSVSKKCVNGLHPKPSLVASFC